jgi:hypothetical protein
MMRKMTAVSILIIVLTSCNRSPNKVVSILNEAGKNKEELENVLFFYKKDIKDSLKLKAAIFLIENMRNHYSYKPLSGFEDAFDSISKYPMNDYRKAVFRKILDSVSHETTLSKTELIPDSKFINSKCLRNNIEQSFESWLKIPKNKRASFEDFCNYILPYKNSDEPIEEGSRKKLAEKYSWVSSLLKKGNSLKFVVDSVCSEFDFEIIKEIRSFYPQTLSISQIEKTRFGLCDDGVNYLINVFRSLGIISAHDMTPHWGNHPSLGHSWLYVKYGDQEYSTDVQGKIDLKKEYLGESIPKVMRRTYAYQDVFSYTPNTKDVTNTYVPTVNITIADNYISRFTKPVICVFDINDIWKPVSFGKYNHSNIVYTDLGVNVLYVAADLEENLLTPITYPFFIDKTKKINFFKPGKSILKSVALTRKISMSSPRSKRVIDWIKNLNQGIFQGANDESFNDAETLYQISNFNSTHIKTIKLKLNKKYKYVRFYSNKKESYLAKLAFYDFNGNKLKGNVIKKNNRDFKWENGAYDNDPLSFSGGKDFSLGLKFSKPEFINAIEFQVRNDNNHINIGEEYQLLFWCNEWKTLGTKIATDTILNYDIPTNSLLLLKNLTGGEEEHVFHINKNKKQTWLGSDN